MKDTKVVKNSDYSAANTEQKKVSLKKWHAPTVSSIELSQTQGAKGAAGAEGTTQWWSGLPNSPS